jgi:hypothetical protein
MTMIDEPDAPIVPKKSPTKKKAKKPQRKAASPAPPVPAQFAGMSTTECCDGCKPDRCVISGMNYCAHPFKGGLHSPQMQDPEALKRANRAKASLRNQVIDLRGR